MIDFSNYINLPLTWSVIISFIILLYILLDGFDLGIGILFPFAPNDNARDEMMASIAPFWNGNETWLVLGGGALFAAFPLAYSILCPAFYIPLTLMLLALIFRGIAFEFRLKATINRKILWDYAFHFGSIVATICQGLILGSFVQGVSVENNLFVGNYFDFLNSFSITLSIALIFSYSAYASTWLIMKTCNELQNWAKETCKYLFIYITFFAFIIPLWIKFIDPNKLHNFDFYIIFIGIITIITLISLFITIKKDYEIAPFFICSLFLSLNFITILLYSWPFIVPYTISFDEAAAISQSLSLNLLLVLIFFPLIISYTIYSYYIFRGKSCKTIMYH
jgi:cytochrome d ubiquinol oxidase subunit II